MLLMNNDFFLDNYNHRQNTKDKSTKLSNIDFPWNVLQQHFAIL